MKDKYKNWIIAYEERVGNVINKCESATLEMQQAFPELIRVRGNVIIPYSNRRPEHWWLKTPDGTIIDPTEIQFVLIIEYLECDESHPDPIGKCLQCGAYVYPGAPSSYTCSEYCSDKFAESLSVKNIM